MKLLRRLWAWLSAAFRKQDKYLHDWDHALFLDELILDYWTKRRRSANICIASHGTTRRQKDNARRRT